MESNGNKLPEEVKSVKFYYENSNVVGNLYTVCLFLNGDDVLSRGIAICSLRDQHMKSTARNIAQGRAIKALKKKSNSEEINDDRFPGQFFLKKITGIDKDKIKLFSNECEKLSIMYRVSPEYGEGKHDIVTSIRAWLPMEVAKKDFKFKSEYNPTVTEREKAIISKDKTKRK